MTVTVTANERGMPLSFSSGKSTHQVAVTEDMWKINDEWWRGPGQEIERVYFRVLLADGRPITLFHDLVRNAWFRQ